MADIATVVRDLLRQAQLSEAQVDTSALQGWLPGMVLSQRTSLKNVLEQLQAFWQFDTIESGGVLTFRPRGQAPLASIDASECRVPEDQPHEPVTITRLPPLALPEQLDVVYSDIASDYQRGTQGAWRQTASGNTPVTVEVPLALSADAARRQAQRLLDAAWAERWRFHFSLPQKYLHLEAGDVITLTVDATPWTIRLVRIVHHNGWLQCEAVGSDTAVWQQQATGAVRAVSPGVIATGNGSLLALDIPLVDESDDSAGYFLAAGKARGDRYWRFATVHESWDNTTYTPLAVLVREAITGTATTVLSGNAPTAFLDNGNSVTVQLADGELASTTDALLLNGANTAMLGDEMLQFGNAELTGAFTYKLSRLLRGRRGTEWAMGSHAIGERFVLLGSEVVRQPLGGNIGITRYLKGVPNGQIAEDISGTPFTPNALSLKPFAPVHLRGSRNTGSDLLITWIRRTRRTGTWLSGSDVPLGEEQEKYTVEILSGSTVVRTSEVNVNTYNYPASQQITDFGSVQGSVDVRVYQHSAVTGQGYPASGVL